MDVPGDGVHVERGARLVKYADALADRNFAIAKSTVRVSRTPPPSPPSNLLIPQIREAQVAAKLKQEVVVLDQRLAEIDVHISVLKKKVRETPDRVGKKMAFMQMKNLQKQAVRFTRLYQICSSMEDDVREQAIMKNTSTVLQEFVNHHEELIKDSSMQKLVEQYEELQMNVEDITNNAGYVGDVLRATTDQENGDVDWDEELEAFLAEDDGFDDVSLTASATKHVPLPPETQTIPNDGKKDARAAVASDTTPRTPSSDLPVVPTGPVAPVVTTVTADEEEEIRRRRFAEAFETATEPVADERRGGALTEA